MDWNFDRIAGILECVDALHEKHRARGDFRPGLGGMLLVIQPDAENLGWRDRREDFGDLGGLAGGVEIFVDAASKTLESPIGVLDGIVRGVF